MLILLYTQTTLAIFSRYFCFLLNSAALQRGKLLIKVSGLSCCT